MSVCFPSIAKSRDCFEAQQAAAAPPSQDAAVYPMLGR